MEIGCADEGSASKTSFYRRAFANAGKTMRFLRQHILMTLCLAFYGGVKYKPI